MPFGTLQAWGVVLPVEKPNLVANPSGERGTRDWYTAPVYVPANGLGTFGTVANKQTFGAWSYLMRAEGTTGPQYVAYGPITLGAGTNYSVSAYLFSDVAQLAGAGGTFDLALADGTNGAVLGSVRAYTGGTWQRYSFAYAEQSGGTRFVQARLPTGVTQDAPANDLYIDGLQVEVGSVTTYIDGDQEGCYWTGAPHNSTSVRSGTYRGGGSVVSLADLGLISSETPGIGMPPLETTSQSFALVDGAEFQRQRAKPRTFSLNSYIAGQSRSNLHQQRQAIIDALKIDLVSPQQPTRFWYVGGPGTVQIDAVVDSGMEYGASIVHDGFTEHPGVRFIAHDPFFSSTTDQGTSLSPRTSLGSVRHIAWRDPLGRWGTMGVNGTTVQLNGGDPSIYTILPLTGGTLLLGGNWGTVGGTVSPAIGRWDQATNRFGTFGGTVLRTNPAATYVFKLIQTPSGTVFLGGDFGTVAGTQGAWYIAQWTGAAFGTLIGGTLNQPVNALLYQGSLMVGGQFTLAGGSAARFMAQHVSNAWGTLTGGGTLSSGPSALARGLDGRIFIGGVFSQVAGTLGTGVAFWNGTYGTMGNITGLGAFVNALAVAPSGLLYLGGQFTAVNGGSAAHLASYNGVQMFPAGSGLTATFNPVVNTILVDKRTAEIYVGGAFTNAGGIPIADGLAVYNGYAFHGPDIAITPAGTYQDIQQSQDGTIYAAGTFIGAGICASVAQIYNTGRTETYPVLKVRTTSTGTARIYQFLNTLTGDAIYFNYSILPGEEVTLDLTQPSRTFTSSFLGNIYGNIIPGSNIATWRLMPGMNWISFFADSANVQASLYWRPTSWSADAGTAL